MRRLTTAIAVAIMGFSLMVAPAAVNKEANSANAHVPYSATGWADIPVDGGYWRVAATGMGYTPRSSHSFRQHITVSLQQRSGSGWKTIRSVTKASQWRLDGPYVYATAVQRCGKSDYYRTRVTHVAYALDGAVDRDVKYSPRRWVRCD